MRTLKWLRNAAPNPHPAFGSVRDVIKTRFVSESHVAIPPVTREELWFFSEFFGACDGVNFFPQCPHLLVGVVGSNPWAPLRDFPQPVVGEPPRLLSLITR